ncbi:hypothetical protein [Deinococcus multiflagellatus]|uniref:hypothetical protein n=1 Tax=Deinococcus multiflagellatus TaxID=1656887 RepID=UPI001CCAF538|nr:hypothetical protein [Deinococcus multiflagellatus]MBZ9713099.1 hypothetical protein [Deinococcus multiflagellatus]
MWQLEAGHLFAAAESLPPAGKALAQREQVLREVLAISEQSVLRDIFDSDQLFGRWVRGRARLLLGEYGVAVQELAGGTQAQAEDLFNRALLAALDLELAMTPLDKLRLPLHEAEQRFRAVFEDARTIPYADPEGLAALVGRWHPQAAVYAALMPQPVLEFLPALDLILRVSNRASWRGQAVPAPLVAHLTRLGLRVPTIGLSVGGNVAYQIARLGREENGVKIWGPVLPLLPMLVALARGGPDHLTTARRAWKDFGVLPTGNHNDPALADVVEVWRVVVDGQRPLADGLRALQDL